MGYAPDNPASWRDVLEFIEEFPDDDTWGAYKKDMRAILESGIAVKLNEYFRAGNSMHYILFSTLPHHGLNGERFVTLARKEGLFVISYSHRYVDFYPPTSQQSVTTPEQAFAILRSFLLRLWKDTKPNEQPPIALLS